MENPLLDWTKTVKIEMLRRNMSTDKLSREIGMSRAHTSSVINGRVLSVSAASAISNALDIQNAPHSAIKQEISEWGKEVRIALIQRNWKTRDLAQAIGKSRDYTAGIIKGYNINQSAAKAICELLGISDAPYSNW